MIRTNEHREPSLLQPVARSASAAEEVNGSRTGLPCHPHTGGDQIGGVGRTLQRRQFDLRSLVEWDREGVLPPTAKHVCLLYGLTLPRRLGDDVTGAKSKRG